MVGYRVWVRLVSIKSRFAWGRRDFCHLTLETARVGLVGRCSFLPGKLKWSGGLVSGLGIKRMGAFQQKDFMRSLRKLKNGDVFFLELFRVRVMRLHRQSVCLMLVSSLIRQITSVLFRMAWDFRFFIFQFELCIQELLGPVWGKT